MDLNEARVTEGVPVLPDDDDDAVDPHLERITNESGGDDSDGEDDGGSTMMILEGMNLMPVVLVVRRRNLQRRRLVSKPSTSRKNSPEMAISAFKFFSRSEIENVKKSNPGISFADVGKIIGERWIKLSDEEKEPFEAMAKADKKRYSKQISDYKNPRSADCHGIRE